jgi:hypothetical protein
VYFLEGSRPEHVMESVQCHQEIGVVGVGSGHAKQLILYCNVDFQVA